MGGGSPSKKWSLQQSSQGSSSWTDQGLAHDMEKNTAYVNGLIENLTQILDKWIITGSPSTRTSAFNLVKQIERESMDKELVLQAQRMVKRAGLPLAADNNNINDAGSSPKELGKNDAVKRREEAESRKKWEASFQSTGETGKRVSDRASLGRSAFSQRAATNSKPDIFLSETDRRLDPQHFSEDKSNLQNIMESSVRDNMDISGTRSAHAEATAAAKVSELVARAGAGTSFDGETLGIGGLDNVLSQVKRRVWTPLAAPPQLLEELGIHPVRGLLLYGRPGCGKTLMARTIGRILSPMRPITVVSGPEIMDKFVGSSEKNLREIFDNPPDIYDTYRISEADNGDSIAKAALHVIIMDEFDAIARARGGRGGKGDQGDAGVARDSVVNQLLAKMDGIDPLKVPTLVIGLTNKRSLIEPALLRPGRFEVQIEVPPPRTAEQRISILRVHTKNMNLAGRLLVKDAPPSSAAARYFEKHGKEGLISYEELLIELAAECDGMSGASLAGVARAAASHALERAVSDFSISAHLGDPTGSLMDCLVTKGDFVSAIQDVQESMGVTDGEENPTDNEGKPEANANGANSKSSGISDQ